MSGDTTNEKLINDDNPQAERGNLCSTIYDPTNTFVFNNAPGEVVYKNDSANCYIVLGRDRPGGWSSGYGGLGHLKAGAIDIVTGRVSALDARICGPVNPSFGADAARIYLSQKTDVDKNFALPDGITGQAIAQSAVAVKADDVRLIGRDSLKLVTYADSLLSSGYNAYKKVGVQLIAKNKDNVTEEDMHPIPKGKALVEAFQYMIDYIIELNSQVDTFLKLQTQFNTEIADHTHYSPFYAQKTSLDPNLCIVQKEMHLQTFSTVEQGLKFNAGNFSAWKDTFLNVAKPTYINSEFHYLN